MELTGTTIIDNDCVDVKHETTTGSEEVKERIDGNATYRQQPETLGEFS